MSLLRLIWAVVHALFAKKADLVAENLALRQQLNVLRRKVGRAPSSIRPTGRLKVILLPCIGFCLTVLRRSLSASIHRRCGDHPRRHGLLPLTAFAVPA